MELEKEFRINLWQMNVLFLSTKEDTISTYKIPLNTVLAGSKLGDKMMINDKQPLLKISIQIPEF